MYRQQALGARVVVNLAGTVDRIGVVRLWVSNRSPGVAKVVALVRASLGLGLLNYF